MARPTLILCLLLACAGQAAASPDATWPGVGPWGARRAILAERSVAFPVPPGYCALDPSDPADRDRLARLGPLGARGEVLFALLPCGRFAAWDGSEPPGDAPLLMYSAQRTSTGAVLPQVSTREDFLDRIDRNAAARGPAPEETHAAQGVTEVVTRVRYAGRDANAAYLTGDFGPAQPGAPPVVCSATGTTLARRMWVWAVLVASCQPTPDPAARLPVVRDLAARVVMLNPGD